MLNKLHQRISSETSTLTMIFSDEFTNVLENVEGSNPTHYLLQKAQDRLKFLRSSENLIPGSTVHAVHLLEAMLVHAPTERGQRYTASTIICCGNHALELVGLATDWLKFLLWPFKSAYRNHSPTASYHSTPTIARTEATTVPENRDVDFLQELVKRQNMRCAIIEVPPAKISLIGAHIIRRSIAKSNNSDAGLHHSLPVTWNILRHYADLSDQQIEHLDNTIGSPQNGVLLEETMRRRFDEFSWYFQSTVRPSVSTPSLKVHKGAKKQTPNMYKVVWLGESTALYDGHGRGTVIFTNGSDEPINLPEVKFIQIHAAIAKVLHASGVGEYLDLVMDTFNLGSSSGALSGQDLELRMSLLSLAGGHSYHLPTQVPVT